jgi:ABC-type antimicrobial peptide transport system permease subunit
VPHSDRDGTPADLFTLSAGSAAIHVHGDSRRRTAMPGLASSVRKQIAGLNRNVPITHLEPLSSVIERARAESRFVSVLATLLSIVALQLALGGIYGVLSYSVVLRTAEIGIRMAVGAQRTQIMRLVFAEGLIPVALGIVVGAILSAASMPLLDHLLFEIKPGSLEVYLLSIVSILLLSGIAMLVPALRAIRIDPLTALACE